MTSVKLIASVGLNRELGSGGELCWHIPDDLRRFRHLTMGATVIMGRKTWDSLPKKPLPGRRNIEETASGAKYEGAETAPSLEAALEAAANDENVFIIGGESVYTAALPFADTLLLTHIDAADPKADKYFPAISEKEWEKTEESETHTTPDGLAYRYATWQRRTP